MSTPLTIGTARALLGRNAPAIIYQLGPFRFATDEAAPMASPHTEAGAVGSLTLVQTDGQYSTSGGNLVIPAQTTPVVGDLGFYHAAGLARVCGRALLGTPALSTGTGLYTDALVWNAVSAAPVPAQFVYALEIESATVEHPYEGASAVGGAIARVSGQAYDYALVLRSTGCWWLRRLSGGGSYTLYWVSNTGSQATLYAGQQAYQASGTLGNFRVTDLGGAFATDTGIATSYKATTTDADTATMTADALVYHTITAQTGVTQELHFRKTDASNYWLLRMAAPGTNTIKVIEVVASVETERASTAQTFTNAVAYRIGVIAAGAVVTPFVDNVAKTGYASAATGLSATGVYVSHAGAKLECWPRNPAVPSGV